MSGLICAGNVYLDQYVSGALTGAVGPINCTKFSLSPGKADSLDRISYMRDTFGQALDSVVFPGVSSLSIETDDAGAEILNYALLGTLSDIADSQGSVTSGSPESVVARLGKWIKLANRNVASVVVKSDDTTPVTYQLTTDYTLDATAGMIFIPTTTPTIGDGDTLRVSYNYGARSGKQIIAATQNEIRAKIRLDGKNLATQKKVEIIVHEAVLIPSGELDIAGKKFVSFSLSGSLVTPTGQSGPFTYREITDTAYTP